MAEEEDGKDSSGDSTDVFSSRFDPLKAFYADQVQIPDAEAPVFDNISKFESFCSKSSAKAKADCNDAKAGHGKSSTLRSLTREDSSCDRGRKRNICEKNVVNRMAKFVGPLSALYQYMENKIKVKICTRGADGISGHIEAYVVAFDTHWNLALEDCVKVWTRKRARKAYTLGGKSTAERQIDTRASTVTVKKKDKRTETLERHVPQLLLRGEHVVSVIKME